MSSHLLIVNILLKVEAAVTGNTFAVVTDVTVMKCEMAVADKTADKLSSCVK